MKQRCSSILKAALALVLAVILLVGTMTVGLAALRDDLAKTGDTFPNGNYIYLHLNNNWSSAGWIAAYFCGGSAAEQWAAATVVPGTDSYYYRFTVPAAGYQNVIFCRMNTSYQGQYSFDYRWDQTANLNFYSGTNCYNIPADVWGGSGDGDANWTLYTPPVETVIYVKKNPISSPNSLSNIYIYIYGITSIPIL